MTQVYRKGLDTRRQIKITPVAVLLLFAISLFLCWSQGFGGLNSETVNPQGQQKH